MRTLVAGAVAAILLSAASAAAITLPSGFTSEVIASGFDKPVAVVPAPDGRIFVTEKKGLLWLIKNGVKGSAPILDIRAEVNKEADRGLLGMTLHPDFPHTPYIYLLYVFDNVAGTSHQSTDEAVTQRLVRYTVVGDTIDTSTKKILFGSTAADSPAECFSSHAIGTVRFGLDGSLIVSVGDGAHWDFPDAGQDVISTDPTCAQVFGAAQDIGSFRAQSFSSLAGKVLRLDPETGKGLSSNPFYDGNPDSFRSKIYALGFKNPFRFAIKQGTSGPGSLYVGDVGTDIYEEVDLAHGGENFGWPCFEGPDPQPQYQTDSHTKDRCAQISSSQVVKPLYASAHNHTNRATGGIIEYTGTSFPSKYRGAFFIADYAQSFIHVLHVDSQEHFVSVEDFATGADSPVDLEMDPRTGDILYTAIVVGEVRRLHYSTSNQPPQVVASAQPQGGSAPLTVQLSSNGTADPEGDQLSFDWDFGDGSAHSSEANPTHVYQKSGNFTAKLTATDSHGNAASATCQVSTTNAPPVVQITAPPNGYQFVDNEQIQFQATASDPNGDALTYNWDVRLIHAAHIHFDQFSSSLLTPPPFTALSHGTSGDRYSYLVIFTATDPGGLSAQSQIHLVPQGLTNGAPTAAFNATPQSGPKPLTVTFDSSTSTDPDGDLLTSDWDFGDGTIGTGTQVSHTYDVAGSYTAKLTVTDIIGASSSTTRTIQVLPPGSGSSGSLVARWSLDETAGTTASDSSGNGLTGTVSNGTWGTGKLGGALVFNGTSTKVKVSSSPLLAITGQLTVSAWAKITDPTKLSYMRLVAKKPTWDAAEGYMLSYNPGKQLFEMHGSGTDRAQATGVKVDTGWHHFAATVDGGTAHLYVDGVERASDGTLTPLVAGSSSLLLGDDSGTNYLQGSLDEVRIYNTALSASDVATLASGGDPTTTKSDIAKWNFDETSGTVATDALNGISCNLTGTTWTTGKTGGALSFSGSGSGGSCGRPAVASFGGDATIATWVKIKDPTQSAYMRLVSSKTSWDATSGFDLTYNPAKKVLQYHGSGSDTGNAASVALDTGWHHLAAVQTGTTVRLYVDGVDRTTDPSVSALVGSTSTLRLGRDDAGNVFAGSLDDLRLYARALSASEIAALASGQ